VANIHANTPEDHYIAFCVADSESRGILDELGEWYLDDSDIEDHRYVTRMNALVRQADDAPTLFFGSDDVIFHPGWLSEALRVMDGGPDVVVVNDLHNRSGTQALMRASYLPRAVFDSPGDAFHGGYVHNFADTEQFFTAGKLGVLDRAMDSIVEHLHPVFGFSNALKWDDTYLNARAGWKHDEELFLKRRAMIERWAVT